MKLLEFAPAIKEQDQLVSHQQLSNLILRQTGNRDVAMEFYHMESDFESQNDMNTWAYSTMGDKMDMFSDDIHNVNSFLKKHSIPLEVVRMTQDKDYNSMYELDTLGVEIKENQDQPLPPEVKEFVNNLKPDDVGVDTVGEYIIHYEGFTDECNDGQDEESIDKIYDQVYQDFNSRQGQKPLIQGVANDELGCENNPVLYSVYKNVNENERNLNPDVKDYVKGKKTKFIKVKVADLDDDAIDDRFGRVIDVDSDVGVDLDKPILIDIDGKTILDGFHRVYQAKRVGRKVIPAEIIDENFADGKKKGKSRPGRVKRSGASCKGSVTSLRAKAKKYSGERGKMYHWCANMKSGKKKSK